MKNEDVYGYALAQKKRYDRYIEMAITGENRSKTTLDADLPRITYMEKRREFFSAICSLPIRNN